MLVSQSFPISHSLCTKSFKTVGFIGLQLYDSLLATLNLGEGRVETVVAERGQQNSYMFL